MTTDLTPPVTAGPNTGANAGRAIVAVAWPTGRPIYAYTPEEIVDGVDLYTRRLKAAHRAKAGEQDA